MMVWQLADAKNRLSEVVNRALNEGPQRITRRGEDAVVLMSEAQYQRAMGEQQSFTQYLCSGPSLEGLELQRDPTPMRDVDL
jgi:prevent-host-death family protein